MSIESSDTTGAKVWLVSAIRAYCEPVKGYRGTNRLCEVVGIFGNEAAALAACTDSNFFMIGPMRVGDTMTKRSLNRLWRCPHHTDGTLPPLPGEDEHGDY